MGEKSTTIREKWQIWWSHWQFQCELLKMMIGKICDSEMKGTQFVLSGSFVRNKEGYFFLTSWLLPKSIYSFIYNSEIKKNKYQIYGMVVPVSFIDNET